MPVCELVCALGAGFCAGQAGAAAAAAGRGEGPAAHLGGTSRGAPEAQQCWAMECACGSCMGHSSQTRACTAGPVNYHTFTY